MFFPGSYIDSKTVDFSEKLRNDRKQGYTVVWTGEPKKEEETPLKKYKRLNCEGLYGKILYCRIYSIFLVRELLDDIKNSRTDPAVQSQG